MNFEKLALHCPCNGVAYHGEQGEHPRSPAGGGVLFFYSDSGLLDTFLIIMF